MTTHLLRGVRCGGRRLNLGVRMGTPLRECKANRYAVLPTKVLPSGNRRAINVSASSKPTEDGSDASVWKWSDSEDALAVYGVFLGILLIGNVPQFQASKMGDLLYFISLAVITIYMGAHRGLNSKERAKIDLKNALLAPGLASVSLFGFFLIIKYLPDFSLQTILDVYFFMLATFATLGALSGPLKAVAQKANLQVKIPVKIPEALNAVDAEDKRVESLPLYGSDIVVTVIALALAFADFSAHHSNFTLSNMIACLIAADILNLIGLSSFRVAGILLIGMLLYDVTWVFASPGFSGENVMLKVATSDVMTGPTRLLFPKIPGSMGEASFFPFALLGLGDIAIPGLLCCLALRYDASRSVDISARGEASWKAIMSSIENLNGEESGDEIMRLTGSAAEKAYDKIADMELENRNASQGNTSVSGEPQAPLPVSQSVMYNRPYFTAVMVAYVVGLSMAFVANDLTGLGQPALLYLVPCCLSALVYISLKRGELDRLWHYRDREYR
jgi:minor histocompatibility antigen H13